MQGIAAKELTRRMEAATARSQTLCTMLEDAANSLGSLSKEKEELVKNEKTLHTEISIARDAERCSRALAGQLAGYLSHETAEKDRLAEELSNLKREKWHSCLPQYTYWYPPPQCWPENSYYAAYGPPNMYPGPACHIANDQSQDTAAAGHGPPYAYPEPANRITNNESGPACQTTNDDSEPACQITNDQFTDTITEKGSPTEPDHSKSNYIRVAVVPSCSSRREPKEGMDSYFGGKLVRQFGYTRKSGAHAESFSCSVDSCDLKTRLVKSDADPGEWHVEVHKLCGGNHNHAVSHEMHGLPFEFKQVILETDALLRHLPQRKPLRTSEALGVLRVKFEKSLKFAKLFEDNEDAVRKKITRFLHHLRRKEKAAA